MAVRLARTAGVRERAACRSGETEPLATPLPAVLAGPVVVFEFPIANAYAKPHAAALPAASRGTLARLLNLDFGARVLELLLDRGGFVLVHAFFHRLRRAVHQVLGLFQAQAGHFADGFDH